ncbi:hypothetical protein [Actinopolymorpha pittospori]|uniref:Protoporphyrinogen oxidase n=1 Tax=Actinopolymorpha pittospori TaxID=648752 RepID=A0A927MZU8_9ACTN|nr:hypothetical protein [Actinopolymorpha pittospori]MBE1610010.1 protoporphyrinogen oxidase [Actinopolymorpha pittospori]
MADLCERLWRAVEDSDDETKAQVRAAIDELMDAAELDADAKAVRASRAERQAGVKGVWVT